MGVRELEFFWVGKKGLVIGGGKYGVQGWGRERGFGGKE